MWCDRSRLHPYVQCCTECASTRTLLTAYASISAELFERAQLRVELAQAQQQLLGRLVITALPCPVRYRDGRRYVRGRMEP